MRIRTIKPEFWNHPVLSRLPDSIRLGAIALLNISDDEGFFYADPSLLRSIIWPFDENSTRARRLIDECVRIGWCEVSKNSTHGDIGRVVNFLKHQRLDRPNTSKIKGYFNSTNIRRSIDDQSTAEQGSGNRDQGKEQGAGNGELALLVVPPSAPPEKKSSPKSAVKVKAFAEECEQLWAIYPRPVCKKPAFDAMRTALKTTPFEVLKERLTLYAASVAGQLPKYIPYPATWFNRRQWEDEIVSYQAMAVKPRLEHPKGSDWDPVSGHRRGPNI